MRKFVLINILFFPVFLFSQMERRIQIRTVYFDSAQKVKNVEIYSENGLLTQMRRYDYAGSHRLSSGSSNDPEENTQLLYTIKYTYDSLGRPVSEMSNSLLRPSFMYVYADSGAVQKQMFYELENRWQNYESWIINERGDTCEYKFFGGAANPSEGRRCEFVYAGDRVLSKKYFLLTNKGGSPEWVFRREDKYFYSSVFSPDSIYCFDEKGKVTANWKIFYSEKYFPAMEVINKGAERLDIERSFDKRGKCTKEERKYFLNGILQSTNTYRAKYNRFGLPEKEYYSNEQVSVKIYKYEFY